MNEKFENNLFRTEKELKKESVLPTEGKHVIVEVGTLGWPFMTQAKNEAAKLKRNEVYVGIEQGFQEVKDSLENLKSSYYETKIGEGKTYMVQGWGEHMPLKEGSVDEVILGNVLGSTLMGHGPSKNDEQRLILISREVWRVLKVNGKAFIVETMTPPINKEYDDIIDQFAKLGFELIRKVAGSSKNASEKFGRFKDHYGGRSYILEFTKKAKDKPEKHNS